MKRFASLATAAALAGSLIGAGTAAQAATMSLVPVSDINAVYHAGSVINFAVVLTLANSSFGSFSVPAAVGYINTQFDDPDPSAGPQTAGNGLPGFGPDTTAKFSGPNASGGTSNYTLWTLNAPNILSQGNGTFLNQPIQCADPVVGHPNQTLTVGGVKSTIVVPAGTYTVATYAFSVASTYTTGPLSVFLPTPLGYSNAANNTDGAFVSTTGPSFLINGKTPLGVATSEVLSFPTAGQMLTFNAPTSTTPAPSSLLVVAMGAIPAVSVLRRRRAAK